MTKKIIIGKLGAAYGVRGWLHLSSYTDPPNNIFNYPQWHLQKHHQQQVVSIEKFQAHGDGFVVKLADCNDREKARTLTNYQITVDKATLPPLPDGEYYWDDLIGLRVQTTQGTELGTVDHLLGTGANDVLVIKGNKRHLIPYTSDTIKSIDLEQQTIVVDWDPDF